MAKKKGREKQAGVLPNGSEGTSSFEVLEKEFSPLRQRLLKRDEEREEVLAKARKALRESKQAIFALHRGDVRRAETSLKEVQEVLGALRKKGEVYSAFHAAVQEWVEAVIFLHFIKTGKLLGPSRFLRMGVSDEDYLLGLCDATGELARRAVVLGAGGDVEGVRSIRSVVEDVFGVLLGFDLRNGELRKKSDAIKWNLKRVEEVWSSLPR
ncbi:hypothetical protein D6783_00330 [Candidatus Woesearchaeota archaeon]|nr:MAG: hypothetical protein D6783_00330 [Candidatus Woesearchaeota archaeon]